MIRIILVLFAWMAVGIIRTVDLPHYDLSAGALPSVVVAFRPHRLELLTIS